MKAEKYNNIRAVAERMCLASESRGVAVGDIAKATKSSCRMVINACADYSKFCHSPYWGVAGGTNYKKMPLSQQYIELLN